MTNLTMYRGSVEYIEVPMTVTGGTLDGVVEPSFDRTTWTAATWLGSAGSSRTCRLLLNTTALTYGTHSVYVRLTDTPEIPVLLAGTLQVL